MLGNDVVDLSDPETLVSVLHPRFDVRVFTPSEREVLAQSDAAHEWRWSFWAAKESAYKLVRRIDPKVIFSPSQFRVQRTANDAGIVTFGKKVFSVHWSRQAATVHAVCTLSALDESNREACWISQVAEIEALKQVRETQLSPSAAVRRLAVQTLAQVCDLDSTRLCVAQSAQRIPYFCYEQERLDLVLSLSHHGRFVAFSCTLPTQTLARRRAA